MFVTRVFLFFFFKFWANQSFWNLSWIDGSMPAWPPQCILYHWSCKWFLGCDRNDSFKVCIPWKPQCFPEEAVQRSMVLRSLLQHVVKNCSKWLSVSFGSRFLNRRSKTAQLCPVLSSLSSCKHWDCVHPCPSECCLPSWDYTVLLAGKGA